MTDEHVVKSAILLIRIPGGLPGRSPTFSYLTDDGLETPVFLPTRYAIESVEPRKGFLSRWRKPRTKSKFVEGNAALPMAVEGEFAKGIRKYIIDLKEVARVSSTGIGRLAAIWTQIRNRNGAVVFANASPRLRDVFEITKLDHIFTCVGSVDEAVQYLRGQ